MHLLGYTLSTLIHRPSDNVTLISSDAWPQSGIFELHALPSLTRRSPVIGELMRHSAQYPGLAAIHPSMTFLTLLAIFAIFDRAGFGRVYECDHELLLRHQIKSTSTISKDCCVMNGYVRSKVS